MYRPTVEEIASQATAQATILRNAAAMIDHALATTPRIKHTSHMAMNAAISLNIAAAACDALAEHATGQENEPVTAEQADRTLAEAVNIAYTVTRRIYQNTMRLCRQVEGTGLADPALKANMRLSEADVALSYVNLVLGGKSLAAA